MRTGGSVPCRAPRDRLEGSTGEGALSENDREVGSGDVLMGAICAVEGGEEDSEGGEGDSEGWPSPLAFLNRLRREYFVPSFRRGGGSAPVPADRGRRELVPDDIDAFREPALGGASYRCGSDGRRSEGLGLAESELEGCG